MTIVLEITQFGDVCKTLCLPIVLGLQKVGKHSHQTHPNLCADILELVINLQHLEKWKISNPLGKWKKFNFVIF
jgi:hypothetical protein